MTFVVKYKGLSPYSPELLGTSLRHSLDFLILIPRLAGYSLGLLLRRIAELAHSHKEPDWQPNRVGHCVQLCVYTTFDTVNRTSTPPFLLLGWKSCGVL